jgi:hypothetical protein
MSLRCPLLIVALLAMLGGTVASGAEAQEAVPRGELRVSE